jgi:Uma2 family endonuclease
MAIVIGEENLPATLTAPLMTDEEFIEFCSQYPDHFIETTSDGEVVIMPPNCSKTGMQNAKLLSQLNVWAESDGRGEVVDSSGGFVLPNGARRAPDAAWVSERSLASLSKAQFDGFWHLCPEFVIELKSKSDRTRVLRAKMQEWIDNGALLAWMIDPDSKTVEIYRPGHEPVTVRDAAMIEATDPVQGFVLDLTRVWNPRRR